jgi:hypothetical protein
LGVRKEGNENQEGVGNTSQESGGNKSQKRGVNERQGRWGNESEEKGDNESSERVGDYSEGRGFRYTEAMGGDSSEESCKSVSSVGWRLARDGRRSGELDSEGMSLGRKFCGRSPVRRSKPDTGKSERSGAGYVRDRSRSEGNSGGESSVNKGKDAESKDERSISRGGSYTCRKSADIHAETSNDMQEISQMREQKRTKRRHCRWHMRSDCDSEIELGEGDSWEGGRADGDMTSASGGEDEPSVEAGHVRRGAVPRETLIEDGEGVRKLLQSAPRQPLTALKLLTSRYGDALEVARVLSQALAEPGLSPEWRSELKKALWRAFRGVDKKTSARPGRPP